MLKFAKIAILAMLAVLAVACTSLPEIIPSKKEASSQSPFIDIAVPQEMSVNQDSLNIRDEGGDRLGQMTAKGYVKPDSVIAFYQATMSQNGWSEGGQFLEQSRSLLIFNKGYRSAAISIWEDWVNTVVEINVTQK